MTEVKAKYIIKKCDFPINGNTHDAQVTLSVDGGENYYYCGIGRFTKSFADAVAYCLKYHTEHGHTEPVTIRYR